MVLTQPCMGVRATLSLKGFHPTMVLTQRDIIYAGAFHLLVSIPLWFSLNKNGKKNLNACLVVSIPLWFSLNRMLDYITKVDPDVSIPLWFSLNPAAPNRPAYSACFHPTMVLTQPGSYTQIRCSFTVSIPLWFSLNFVYATNS